MTKKYCGSECAITRREFIRNLALGSTVISFTGISGIFLTACSASAVTYNPKYAYAELSTGIKIAYVELGDEAKSPIVFIHGATDSYISWSQVAPRVANGGHRVIVLELRGHGKSDKPEQGPYTIQTHAADVSALLTQLGVSNAHIVGHSLGTFVAQSLAVEYPDTVKSLTLIGSAATVAGNPTLDWLLNGDGEFLGINNESSLDEGFLRDWTASTNYAPEFIEATYEHAKALPLYVWRNVFNGLSSKATDLSKITVPAQVIWGSEDGFFSRADEDALLAELGSNSNDIEFLIKDGGSHNTHWEGHLDEEVAQDIVAFVKGHQ